MYFNNLLTSGGVKMKKVVGILLVMFAVTGCKSLDSVRATKPVNIGGLIRALTHSHHVFLGNGLEMEHQ